MFTYQPPEPISEQTRLSLFHLASLFLTVGGITYILIQFIHPTEELDSILSEEWFIVALLTSFVGLLNFLGLLGIYIRYAKELDVIGTIGIFLFKFFWLLTMIFSFIEAFILPLLVTRNPAFVEEMLLLFRFGEASSDLGALPILASGTNLLYLLGALLFGVSGYVAELPHKYAYGFLAAAALLNIGPRLAATPYYRMFSIPMGLVLIFLGISLWRNSQRQT